MRQGWFKWYECDPAFYILRALSILGIIWDLKYPPKAVVRKQAPSRTGIISRAAAQLAESSIPKALQSHPARRSDLDGATGDVGCYPAPRGQRGRQHSSAAFAYPEGDRRPRRGDVHQTSSMDDIMDIAQMLILDTIGAVARAEAESDVARPGIGLGDEIKSALVSRQWEQKPTGGGNSPRKS